MELGRVWRWILLTLVVVLVAARIGWAVWLQKSAIWTERTRRLERIACVLGFNEACARAKLPRN